MLVVYVAGMFLRLNRHAITSFGLLFECHVSPDQVSGDQPMVQSHGRRRMRSGKKHAAKQIKRFAHSKKTVEIQVDVEQHFRIGGGFAFGRPVSVFGLISDGIKYFSK
jgi:hypothetical protein